MKRECHREPRPLALIALGRLAFATFGLAGAIFSADFTITSAAAQQSRTPPSGAAPEWPQWGGPRRNFSVDSTGLSASWPDGGPKRLWRRRLGAGHSSILVDGGVLYTMYRPVVEGQQERWKEEEVVAALEAPTGRTIWEHRYAAPLDGIDASIGVGPHATPLLAGDRLFATGTNKQLIALEKRTGRLIWAHDLVREFDAPPHYRIMTQKPGYSCSPLAYRDMVIVTAGGPGQAVMAFRQADGRLMWRSGNFPIAPASPILISVDGQDQIVVFASESVVGLDPNDGAMLWSHPHPRKQDSNVSTPVWSEHDNLLLVSSAHDGGTRVLELSRSGPKELWFTRAMRVYYGTIVRIGDYYFGSSGDLGPAFSDRRFGQIRRDRLARSSVRAEHPALRRR